MAIFKKEAKKDSKKGNKTNSVSKKSISAPNRAVLKGLKVTEKAVIGTPENVYLFSVTQDATKPEIKAAVQVEYNVTPTSVRISKIAKKPIYRRNGWSTKGGGKKAYVTLKEGDTIAVA
jgi:large subunit ribosomal protein L23